MAADGAAEWPRIAVKCPSRPQVEGTYEVLYAGQRTVNGKPVWATGTKRLYNFAVGEERSGEGVWALAVGTDAPFRGRRLVMAKAQSAFPQHAYDWLTWDAEKEEWVSDPLVVVTEATDMFTLGEADPRRTPSLSATAPARGELLSPSPVKCAMVSGIDRVAGSSPPKPRSPRKKDPAAHTPPRCTKAHLGFDLDAELRLTAVVDFGPAAQAGLRVGDYLLWVHDPKVKRNVPLYGDESALMYVASENKLIALGVLRGGDKREAQLLVPYIPPVRAATTRLRRWVELAPSTDGAGLNVSKTLSNMSSLSCADSDLPGEGAAAAPVDRGTRPKARSWMEASHALPTSNNAIDKALRRNLFRALDRQGCGALTLTDVLDAEDTLLKALRMRPEDGIDVPQSTCIAAFNIATAGQDQGDPLGATISSPPPHTPPAIAVFPPAGAVDTATGSTSTQPLATPQFNELTLSDCGPVAITLTDMSGEAAGPQEEVAMLETAVSVDAGDRASAADTMDLTYSAHSTGGANATLCLPRFRVFLEVFRRQLVLYSLYGTNLNARMRHTEFERCVSVLIAWQGAVLDPQEAMLQASGARSGDCITLGELVAWSVQQGLEMFLAQPSRTGHSPSQRSPKPTTRSKSPPAAGMPGRRSRSQGQAARTTTPSPSGGGRRVGTSRTPLRSSSAAGTPRTRTPTASPSPSPMQQRSGKPPACSASAPSTRDAVQRSDSRRATRQERTPSGSGARPQGYIADGRQMPRARPARSSSGGRPHTAGKLRGKDRAGGGSPGEERFVSHYSQGEGVGGNGAAAQWERYLEALPGGSTAVARSLRRALYSKLQAASQAQDLGQLSTNELIHGMLHVLDVGKGACTAHSTQVATAVATVHRIVCTIFDGPQDGSVDRTLFRHVAEALRMHFQLYLVLGAHTTSVGVAEFQVVGPLLKSWGLTCPPDPLVTLRRASGGLERLPLATFCSWAVTQAMQAVRGGSESPPRPPQPAVYSPSGRLATL
eukprot:TRINITY_DN5712_c0_g1_i1.p1 TRINITY_DN5712_c0_g1~~TRINITY_DN5712_c0_g1_i1.p1  ORF type:complete len:1022 (+),score=190.66 TRINITY_DN5712_c0_g1_i1:68-3067(+)